MSTTFRSIAEEFAPGSRGYSPRGTTVASFVAYLNLLLAAPADEMEATDVTEDDAVQVLTVHTAKGLERSVIFMATASEQDFTLPNHKDALPLGLRHPAAGMPIAGDFPDERRYNNALTAWDQNQHRLEEQRIAYVALTRAKDRLYISWHRLPLNRGKDRSPLKVLEHALPLTVRTQFNRDDWDEGNQQPAAPDLLGLARRFARRQAKIWAAWQPDDFDRDGPELVDRLTESWTQYLDQEGESPAGDDLLRSGIDRWRAERGRVETLLSRCLTPALRPPDAGRRPVVEVPTTLSYSMLATYQDCSRKAYLRFMAGFPGEPRASATGSGTAFHTAVEALATAQQAGRESSFDELLQGFTASAADAHGVTLYAISDEEQTMLRSFWDGPDRIATPLLVEGEFYWRVGPGYLHGFIDRIQRNPDGTIELIDFKTSKRALSEAEAKESLQLLIYALASREVHGIVPNRLTLVYPRLRRRVSVSFSDDELQTARGAIVNLMELARTATYDEVNTRHCPLCEYRLICPAAATFQAG